MLGTDRDEVLYPSNRFCTGLTTASAESPQIHPATRTCFAFQTDACRRCSENKFDCAAVEALDRTTVPCARESPIEPPCRTDFYLMARGSRRQAKPGTWCWAPSPHVLVAAVGSSAACAVFGMLLWLLWSLAQLQKEVDGLAARAEAGVQEVQRLVDPHGVSGI
ncbi:unnamed protein product [Symbiodinium necroappetens]|uniref:Uncharacterized protein n=1 Tax=Symbiodinium necroappetens TaxID=1628268 RepID=A0A813BXU9_9DINO|nr:unnamed protein product [Symbiodinium necroappetens]